MKLFLIGLIFIFTHSAIAKHIVTPNNCEKNNELKTPQGILNILIQWESKIDFISSSTTPADFVRWNLNLEILNDMKCAIGDFNRELKVAPFQDFILVCDEAGNLRALGQIGNLGYSELTLRYLVSSPDNLKIPINASPISGSGTAVIKEAIKRSITLGNRGELELYPYTSAIGFYERLGFKTTNKKYPRYFLDREAAIQNFPELFSNSSHRP